MYRNTCIAKLLRHFYDNVMKVTLWFLCEMLDMGFASVEVFRKRVSTDTSNQLYLFVFLFIPEREARGWGGGVSRHLCQ